MLRIEQIPIKCFLFDFHDNFNVLIGAPSLKKLDVIWNLEKDLVKIRGRSFKLKYFKNDDFKKENDTKIEVQKIEIRSNHLNKQEKVEIEKFVREPK